MPITLALLRSTTPVDAPRVAQAIQRRALLYDKSGEEHFNLISALHKSLRESDPDAAVYWLVRMLEAGEDPGYLARRMLRFASEDIGLADPQALAIANAANTELKHGGGVAGALSRAGGPAVQRESDRVAPIGLGEAAETSGGEMPCRWVIHATWRQFRSTFRTPVRSSVLAASDRAAR